MAEPFDISTLNWVKGEIDETLKQARIALQEFVENPADEGHLRFCVSYLHQVRGTLQMVELQGAAYLAEEMEALGNALLGRQVAGDEGRYEVLMRAILQLPDYLESLQNGQPDNPIILLPLLNELRGARSATALNEAYFFTPDLNVMPADPGTPPSADMTALAKKLRNYFQVALLKLLQGKEQGKSLATLVSVLEKLRAGAHSPGTRQWIWIATAYLEALHDHGLELDSASKQLLGKLDQLLKSLAEKGEAAASGEPLARLNRALLYYVGRSSSSGRRVAELKDAFRLRELVPDSEAVHEVTTALGGFNAELKRTVSADVMEEISSVKDVLDIFARSGTLQSGNLEEMVEAMARIAETLGLLGQEELRGKVAGRIGVVQKLIDADAEAGDEVLMDIAEAVLSVEAALKDWGQVGPVQEADVAEEQLSAAESGLQAEAEHRRVVRQVMSVAKDNVVRIREALNAYLEEPAKPSLLAPIDGWLQETVGGLNMLSYKRAALVLQACGAFIDEQLKGAENPPAEEALDYLAEAVMSVEYYLEAFVRNRVHPGAVLEVAERAMARLGYAPDALETRMLATPAEDIAETPKAPAKEETTAAVEGAAESAAGATPVAEVDEEILEIFIEEAEEELDKIAQLLPRWRSEPGDEEALSELRRSYHTIKGSGRLVGAVDVGEFAWTFEKMLNRVIDGSIGHGEALFDALDSSQQALRGLVECFRSGAEPDEAVLQLQKAAEALSQVMGDGQEAPAPVKEGEPDAAVETAIDPVLLDIYANESEGHLATVDSFVEQHREQSTAQVVEPLLRALHTLAGSSRMAGIESVAGLSSTLEQYAKLTQATSVPMGRDGVEALAMLTDFVRATLAHFQDGTPIPDTRVLRKEAERLLEQAQEGLEGEISPEAGLAQADEVEEEGTDGLPVAEVIELVHTRQPEEAAEEEAAEEEIAEKEAAEKEAAEKEAAESAEDYDAELIDIFLEEGAEILDASEETFQAWAANPADHTLVEALQRQLHTLKGSARMAGVLPVGDLSHSLESTFEDIVDGVLDSSADLIELMQLSHDRLAEMLEQVRDHQPVASADELIERIEAARKGMTTQGMPVSPKPEKEVPAEALPSSDLEAAQEGMDGLGEAFRLWHLEQDSIETLDTLIARLQEFRVGIDGLQLGDAPKLCRALMDLLVKIKDGRVALSEGMLSLIELGVERLALQLHQRANGDAVSDSADLRDAVIALLEKSVAEHAGEGAARRGGEADSEKRRAGRIQHEMVRIRSDLLDHLVNNAGEVSIYRSRVEQQIGDFRSNIEELDRTVDRLREHVRLFDIETEAQIESRTREVEEKGYEEEFDPLEFDRFTHMQQLSRSMLEALNDLVSIEDMLLNLTRESETLLLQQARINTELQEGLMHTRMVPLVDNAPRLRRIVRQTCAELGKQANLHFQGAEVEMDRTVVERMMAPLEHMLRNAIAHGLESPEARQAVGKAAEGEITIALSREGAEVLIRVSDDGAGVDLDAVRTKAMERGLMDPESSYTDREVMQFILTSGFSTAKELSQIAGRGVGMDVVNSEVKQLGGVLSIDSESGKGTTFTVRLPLTLSVSRALLVQLSEDKYALPLLSIKGIERIDNQELGHLLQAERPHYRWVGEDYELLHLGSVLGIGLGGLLPEGSKSPLVLAQTGDQRVALVVDGLLGSREIVVKSLGPQLSTLSDLSGATILADGSVALILDMPALIRRGLSRPLLEGGELSMAAPAKRQPMVLVVDDSITVRRVTERLLRRHDMRALTAKDGVDALAVLEETVPDVMLLDIEMPRMDGYELATHIRNTERLRHLPIIMITSRSGEKHRQRAEEIGVDIYMGKPYTEDELLTNIDRMVAERE